VQDCVRHRGDDIREWVKEGAVIYVCGSRRGMSTAVTEALTDILGAATLAEMIELGCYRRDVY
jgi:sulfite reductase (NADPH) flavoprotein alpha-component